MCIYVRLIYPHIRPFILIRHIYSSCVFFAFAPSSILFSICYIAKIFLSATCNFVPFTCQYKHATHIRVLQVRTACLVAEEILASRRKTYSTHKLKCLAKSLGASSPFCYKPLGMAWSTSKYKSFIILYYADDMFRPMWAIFRSQKCI